MISPTEERKCRECEVIRVLRLPQRKLIKRCLSCAVSEELEESDNTIPSLPWVGKFSEMAQNDKSPTRLMRQKSMEKIIHQANMSKEMKLKRLVDKHGACNVVHNTKATYALDFITDIFTSLIDLRWRLMLLFFSLTYLAGWLVFSVLWYCLAWGHQDLGYLSRNDTSFQPCVANVDSFIGAFLFSVETQTTIGYGFRSVTEECWIGATLVVIQSVFSELVDAILVGCVLVKIARPKKRAATIKFSHNAVIAERDGKLCFMLRIGDIRNSHLFGAKIRALLIRPKITPEQECIPLYSHPMDVGGVTGEDNLLLIWPLIICHVIDEKSPLYKYSSVDFLENSFEIVVYLEGIVEETGLLMQARTSYLPSEIKWGYRFSSHIVSMSDDDDKLIVNYSKLNTTYPVTNTPHCSAYELDAKRKTGQLLRPASTNGKAHGRPRKQRSYSERNGDCRVKMFKELRFADEMVNLHNEDQDDPPEYSGLATTNTHENPPTCTTKL